MFERRFSFGRELRSLSFSAALFRSFCLWLWWVCKAYRWGTFLKAPSTEAAYIHDWRGLCDLPSTRILVLRYTTAENFYLLWIISPKQYSSKRSSFILWWSVRTHRQQTVFVEIMADDPCWVNICTPHWTTIYTYPHFLHQRRSFPINFFFNQSSSLGTWQVDKESSKIKQRRQTEMCSLLTDILQGREGVSLALISRIL